MRRESRGTAVKMPLGMPLHPISECLGLSASSTLLPASWKKAGDGSNTWISATHAGNPD